MEKAPLTTDTVSWQQTEPLTGAFRQPWLWSHIVPATTVLHDRGCIILSGVTALTPSAGGTESQGV